MEVQLKNFIKGALVEIATGIQEANKEINPDQKHRNLFVWHRANTKGIVFDVAVTVKTAQKDSAGFFVALATIGGGAKTDKHSGDEVAHRIKFEVDFGYNFESSDG